VWSYNAIPPWCIITQEIRLHGVLRHSDKFTFTLHDCLDNVTSVYKCYATHALNLLDSISLEALVLTVEALIVTLYVRGLDSTCPHFYRL